MSTLVGGLQCQGRCGTLCNGLCSGQRYTADCLNHDKCGQLLGANHSFCNFILSRAFDDCFSAATCTDSPGVWTMRTTWKRRQADNRHAQRLANARKDVHGQRTRQGQMERHGRDDEADLFERVQAGVYRQAQHESNRSGVGHHEVHGRHERGNVVGNQDQHDPAVGVTPSSFSRPRRPLRGRWG